jgi:creatinine amidohydrolase
MSKAVKDYHPSPTGGLTRSPGGESSYSASGIFGDATLATRSKGEIVVRAVVRGMLNEIETLRSSP